MQSVWIIPNWPPSGCLMEDHHHHNHPWLIDGKAKIYKRNQQPATDLFRDAESFEVSLHPLQ